MSPKELAEVEIVAPCEHKTIPTPYGWLCKNCGEIIPNGKQFSGRRE